MVANLNQANQDADVPPSRALEQDRVNGAQKAGGGPSRHHVELRFVGYRALIRSPWKAPKAHDEAHEAAGQRE